jgi:hypothetical protein
VRCSSGGLVSNSRLLSATETVKRFRIETNQNISASKS